MLEDASDGVVLTLSQTPGHHDLAAYAETESHHENDLVENDSQGCRPQLDFAEIPKENGVGQGNEVLGQGPEYDGECDTEYFFVADFHDVVYFFPFYRGGVKTAAKITEGHLSAKLLDSGFLFYLCSVFKRTL